MRHLAHRAEVSLPYLYDFMPDFSVPLWQASGLRNSSPPRRRDAEKYKRRILQGDLTVCPGSHRKALGYLRIPKKQIRCPRPHILAEHDPPPPRRPNPWEEHYCREPASSHLSASSASRRLGGEVLLLPGLEPQSTARRRGVWPGNLRGASRLSSAPSAPESLGRALLPRTRAEPFKCVLCVSASRR